MNEPAGAATGRWWRLAGVVSALVLLSVFYYVDPAGSVSREAALRAARGGLVVLGWGLGAVAIGAVGLGRLAPAMLAGPAAPLHSFALGSGVQAACMTGLAMAGLARPEGAAVVLGVGLLGGLIPGARAMWTRCGRGLIGIGPGALGLGALLLLPALIEALAPPTDTDLLYYHLALPRRIAEEGGLIGGFDHPDGSRPLPVHLIYAAVYGLGGEPAPGLWHLGLCVTLLVGLTRLGEARLGASGAGRWFPALVMLSSWTFLREVGLPYNNLPTALWLLTATDALLAYHQNTHTTSTHATHDTHDVSQGALRWMGLSVGFALASKYTAAPGVAGLGLAALLVVLQRGEQSASASGARQRGELSASASGARQRGEPSAWRGLIVAGILAILPILPWPLRNVAEGLHPLFPYAGWPEGTGFVFMYAEKYGMGRELLDLVLLPWNVLMFAETETWVFLGRVSLGWAALLLVGPMLRWREPRVRVLMVVVLAGWLGWAAGPHWLRYLLPIVGVAGLLGAALRPGVGAWLLLLGAAPANLGPAWRSAGDRVAVVSGQEARDRFLKRSLPAGEALVWMRDELPRDAEVALLFSWYGYYVQQPWRLGSVEDHVPTRYWLWSHRDKPVGALYDAGVRYVLVGEDAFLRRHYAFLSDPAYEQQFVAYERQLKAALLARGTRLFAKGQFAVYRIDPPAGVDSPGAPQ